MMVSVEVSVEQSKTPAPTKRVRPPEEIIASHPLACGRNGMPEGGTAAKYEMTISPIDGWMRIFFAEAVQKRPTLAQALLPTTKPLHRAFACTQRKVLASPNSLNRWTI